MKPLQKIHADRKSAVVYLRTDPEDPISEISLEAQEMGCRREADKRGYEIIYVFKEERNSGKDIRQRPVIKKFLTYCKKNKGKVNSVFVHSLNRISSKSDDYIAIRRILADTGVELISVYSPKEEIKPERIIKTMLAAFEQLDEDIKHERALKKL